MAEKLFMTALSPTMERGIITQWLKKEGDSIVSGDIICEVETDKAVMEYEADFDAVLLKILVSEGQGAAVGETIGVYGEAGEDVSGFTVSAIEAEVVEIAETTESVSDKPAAELSHTSEVPGPASSAGGRRIKVSPLARKMAAAKHISLETVKGSGHDGRIIKRDIERLAENYTASQAAEPVSAESTVTANSAMRSTIADRLTASKFSAPHFYLTMRADMTSLMAARKSYALQNETKISINSYLIKLSAAALKKHPKVNSSWENDGIRKFGSADIGFAVALDDGLIAPVIKTCEQKGIISIDKEFKDLAAKAKKGSLSSSEYSGAGFSISNLGSYGIEEFTAIINPPGSAILAVGAVVKTPIVETSHEGNDELVIKPMMKMTLSCDHRVIDGAVGAAFLAELKKMIENPIEALM